MTKKEALAEFEPIKQATIKHYGKDDQPALCEAWNNFTDKLCKDGQITNSQYHNWDNPF